MNDTSIEQIRHELTWRLRQKVLYPTQQLYEMELEGDEDAMHFGAFSNNELVAIVSLFKNGDDFQFRQFAVAASVQKMGIGSTLLNYITDFAINEGGERLWCNAWVTAIPFYIKYGFEHTGQFYSKNGNDYEVLEKNLSHKKAGLAE